MNFPSKCPLTDTYTLKGATFVSKTDSTFTVKIDKCDSSISVDCTCKPVCHLNLRSSDQCKPVGTYPKVVEVG